MVTRYTVVQDGQVYEPGDDVPDMLILLAHLIEVYQVFMLMLMM